MRDTSGHVTKERRTQTRRLEENELIITLSGTDSIASMGLTGRTKDSDPAVPELETQKMN
jgi:hypothetical protein